MLINELSVTHEFLFQNISYLSCKIVELSSVGRTDGIQDYKLDSDSLKRVVNPHLEKDILKRMRTHDLRLYFAAAI